MAIDAMIAAAIAARLMWIGKRKIMVPLRIAGANEPARLLNEGVSTLLQRKMEYGFERELQIALIHRN